MSSSDDLTDAALKEAAQLYVTAQNISHIQVQQELEEAMVSEVSTAGASSAIQNLPSRDALVSFWVEQGLSANEASRLYGELQTEGRSYTLQQLSTKVSRWSRVLPDTDIAALAFKDSHFLDAEVGNGLMNMIRLVEAFPGRNVISMLVKQPRLLWCADLIDRMERTLAMLVRIHPSGDVEVIRDIIAEYPELLYRMDYYPQATLLDELPMEIQTMMVVGSSGLSYLLRYYKNRATNYAAELELTDPFMHSACEGSDGAEVDECVP